MKCYSSVSKHIKTVWCMLETFLFGGLHFGWASLVYIFKDEGYFSEECVTVDNSNSTIHGSEPVACDYQDGQLALLYSVAMGLSAIPLFLCGTCISRFGYVKTRIIYIFVFAAGCALIIASSAEQPWFASAGLALVAGGRVFYLTNVQVSRLYKTGSFIVIAAMSGCYDSSAATTLFVKLAYDTGISRRVSFGAIIIISVTTALLNTYVSFSGMDFGGNEKKKTVEENTKKEDLLKPSMKEIYQNYVFNKMFISHFSWFSLLMIHLMFFLTSSHIYIQQVVENVHNTTESSLTNFISIALMTGFVPAIVAGFFFELFQHRLKGGVYSRHLKTLAIGFIIVNILSAAMSVLSMFYILPLVSINFILLPIFRGFFFSSTYTYTVKLFPEKAFGVHSSLFDLQTCIILFIQTGIVRWIQSYDDAALHIRITFLVISITAMYHPILTLMKIKRLHNLEKNQEVDVPFTKSELDIGFEVNGNIVEKKSEFAVDKSDAMTAVYGSVSNTTNA